MIPKEIIFKIGKDEGIIVDRVHRELFELLSKNSLITPKSTPGVGTEATIPTANRTPNVIRIF